MISDTYAKITYQVASGFNPFGKTDYLDDMAIIFKRVYKYGKFYIVRIEQNITQSRVKKKTVTKEEMLSELKDEHTTNPLIKSFYVRLNKETLEGSGGQEASRQVPF